MTADTAWIVQQFREAESTFRPGDVNRWNGTSWDYVAVALVADVSPEDRAVAMRLARKALEDAANAQRWFLATLFSRKDPINFFLAKDLPPEAQPTSYSEYQGVKIAHVAEDPYRVERRQFRVAAILDGLEKDPAWKPTKEEIAAIDLRAGIRSR